MGKALRRGERVTERDFTTELEVKLSPIPSLADLSAEDYRRVVRGLVLDIEEETAARHLEAGTRPLGVLKVLATDPMDQPRTVKKSPRPRFHAFSPAVRDAMYNALVWIFAAYADASDRLKRGEKDVKFPEGTFPPGMPFVKAGSCQRAHGFIDEIEDLNPG